MHLDVAMEHPPLILEGPATLFCSCMHGISDQEKLTKQTKTKTSRCVPCSSCLVGQIQVSYCYGNTTVDSTGCKTCNFTSCKPPQACTLVIYFVKPLKKKTQNSLTKKQKKQILINQCLGTGTQDSSRCVTCGRTCAREEYMSKLCSNAECEISPDSCEFFIFGLGLLLGKTHTAQLSFSEFSYIESSSTSISNSQVNLAFFEQA